MLPDRPYRDYFSHTGRCEDDIMKGWLQLNQLPPSVDLTPGPLGQQASAKPTELPELFTHASFRRRQRFTK